jgi:hypothetical protein
VGAYAPTVGVTLQVGTSILESATAGTAVASLFVETIEQNRTT